MDIALLIGRILFGGYFILMALNHLALARQPMTQYAQAKKVPAASLLVPAAGLLLLVGGLAIATGLYPWLGALALVAFLIPVTFMMHDFWNLKDPGEKMGQMTNFMKNIALLGASLMVLGLSGSWPLSLG